MGGCCSRPDCSCFCLLFTCCPMCLLSPASRRCRVPLAIRQHLLSGIVPGGLLLRCHTSKLPTLPAHHRVKRCSFRRTAAVGGCCVIMSPRTCAAHHNCYRPPLTARCDDPCVDGDGVREQYLDLASMRRRIRRNAATNARRAVTSASGNADG